MSKFDIPIIATVEANTFEEARQLVYKVVEDLDSGVPLPCLVTVELTMADDSQTDRQNQRVVFLHPEDATTDYSPEEYMAKLTKPNEEE